MPDIRVNDDVFEGLQKLAKPFIDTPDSVIRQLLQDRGVLNNSGHEPPTLDADPEVASSSGGRFYPSKKVQGHGTRLTPQQVCETFLLHVLATDFEGKAQKREATHAVIQLMTNHGFFDTADLEPMSSGETKAEYIVSWTRTALREKGLINQSSPRGTWELTHEGLVKASETILPKML